MKFLLSSDNEYFSETCGTHGTRTGNFIVQNSDLIISIGARLDTHVTGSPMNTFARGAKKIIVEIDSAEIKKFKKYGLDIDIVFNLNAKTFIHSLVGEIVKRKLDLDINAWNGYIKTLKENYPVVKKEYFKEIEVNPYVFVYYLSKFSPGEEVFFIDTGCSIAWMMQSYDVKKDQKLFHAFNTTPMGYALPASIGGCFALNKKQVTCVSGDGGLQMNIQELATIIHHNLPIKIFLFNNHGYNMIQQTQDQWLSSRYEASSADSGLSFPDFIGLADVYGFKTFSINYNEEAQEIIKKVYNEKGPVFCNVEIKPSHRVIPQNKFGRPIEDSEPLLPRKEFLSRMIVNPMEVSLEE